MTTDSFFTSRNQFDAQITSQAWTPGQCESVIEAATRRMAEVEGTYAAAVRIQRIADICAGMNVQPIATWERVEASIEPDPIEERPPLVVRIWTSYGAAFAYLVGMAVGGLLL